MNGDFVSNAPTVECALAMSVWTVPAALGVLASFGVIAPAFAGPLVGFGVLVQGVLTTVCACRT